MKIEIKDITNGWMMIYKKDSEIWESEMFFKTLKMATSYAKRLLDKISRLEGKGK